MRHHRRLAALTATIGLPPKPEPPCSLLGTSTILCVECEPIREKALEAAVISLDGGQPEPVPWPHHEIHTRTLTKEDRERLRAEVVALIDTYTQENTDGPIHA